MKIFIIGGIILVLILFCSVENFQSQRYIEGLTLKAHVMGDSTPKRIPCPGLTTNYDQYSMYSTKVWPDVYQPTTNTCFDEFMRECTPPCVTEECISSCQMEGTHICSQKQNLPALRF